MLLYTRDGYLSIDYEKNQGSDTKAQKRKDYHMLGVEREPDSWVYFAGYRGEKNGFLVLDIIIFCDFFANVRVYFCQRRLPLFGVMFSFGMGDTGNLGLLGISFLEASWRRAILKNIVEKDSSLR